MSSIEKKTHNSISDRIFDKCFKIRLKNTEAVLQNSKPDYL